MALHTTVYQDWLYTLARETSSSATISLIKKYGKHPIYKDYLHNFYKPFYHVRTEYFELPSGFEVTSFLADHLRGVFFLGSRQGALACYYLSHGATLIGVWRRIHDHESVRSIQLLQKDRPSRAYTELLTTGRNGAYQIIRISFSEKYYSTFGSAVPLHPDTVDGCLKGIEMQYVHRSNLNRGWLEGVLPLVIARTNLQSSMINSSLLLWGFDTKTFSFWNETTGELIFEHNTGGANRIWDFYLPSNATSTDIHDSTRRAWLVYTSKSEVSPTSSLLTGRCIFARLANGFCREV
jgi:hypothetical protein